MHKAVSPGPIAAPPEAILRKVRIPFVRRATLTCRGRDEDAFLVDLGLAGVFVERAEPLPVGELVEVRFTLPGNAAEVHARCRVAWRHVEGDPLVSRRLPAGVGLAFVELAETDRQRLRQCLVEYLGGGRGARRFAPQWPEVAPEADP